MSLPEEPGWQALLLHPGSPGAWSPPPHQGEGRREAGVTGASIMSRVVRFTGATTMGRGIRVVGAAEAGGTRVTGLAATAAQFPVAVGTASAKRPESCSLPPLLLLGSLELQAQPL